MEGILDYDKLYWIFAPIKIFFFGSNVVVRMLTSQQVCMYMCI